MEYRRLGRTNLEVSCIGFGGAPMGLNDYLAPYDAEANRGTVVDALNAALDAGVNYIDSAPGYGGGRGESIIGQVLARRRADAYIATKVPSNLDHAAVIESVDASRKRLNADCIDVLQFHGGYLTEEQYRRLIQEGPLDALKECRARGWIRFIGITNEVPDHTMLWAIASGEFDVIQMRYSLFHQSAADPLLEEAPKQGLGVAIMRPLASGGFRRLLQRVAPEVLVALSPEQVALDFVLSNPNVSVALCGMRTPAEVEQNVRAVAEAKYRWPYHLDRGQGGVMFDL
jgi:aryl-alcohol dehydrogenase-like predicted oxidoreductase